MTAPMLKTCAIVPAFMEAQAIADVVRRIRRHVPDVIVVDDGSADRTAAEAAAAGATVLRHEHNRGKGMALNTGFEYALNNGFELIITLDADGQHDPDDIPRFLEAQARDNCPVLVGSRMADTAAMPVIRRLTNRCMSWCLSREMGQFVPDTQCGYRLYRREVLPYAMAESSRFAAESEVLLRLAARGIRISAVPIATIYGGEQSKIRPIRDTFRFLAMIFRFRRWKKKHPVEKA